ncbi:acyl-CoA carboxylase subunit epsilon [Streptomyces liangshanensis]|uniref:Acyl-CoA carboxylase subunit epsilon n=1 Tax=Streptomyces liangshanensis TaxID=2717324 RepID=A0A6G9H9G6_9ACTN|nr:acyl-CoA carboxylase subunit epsilon [Streptomyces liangshanensis]QIQ06851.1 acyl-CoA carboxylase subunit epsilon [Streptomyces liangshanensis]
MIKVIRGNPTPEELAAALTVVQARVRASGAEAGPPEPPAAWSAPGRVLRDRLPEPGPRSWARTYWPG